MHHLDTSYSAEQLAEKLKQRSDHIKKRLPSKIMNPGHLRQLMQKSGGPRALQPNSRTLAV